MEQRRIALDKNFRMILPRAWRRSMNLQFQDGLIATFDANEKTITLEPDNSQLRCAATGKTGVAGVFLNKIPLSEEAIEQLKQELDEGDW